MVMAAPRMVLCMAQSNITSALKPIDDNRQSSVSFCDAAHNKELLAVFCSLREQDELCDVTLCIGASRVLAHRVVLAGSSPYFRAMFTNGLMESKQGEIVFQDMDEIVFKNIIDYFYTGRIEINDINVQDLISISGLLQLRRIQEACCEFMKRQINTNNCLGIAAFADAHSCIELASSADSFARSHFSDVVQTEEFMMISQSQLLRLIADDGLNVHSEERVFEAVLAWVKYDTTNREEFVSELFEHVRFPLLSAEFLLERVAPEDIMRENESCYKLLIEAAKLLFLPPRGRTLTQSPRETPRKPAAVQQILYAIGGMSRREKLKSGERYDPKEGKWKPIADMNVRRWGADVAALGPYLYICGGSDDQSRLNTVEKYDPFNNVWIPVPAMTTNRNGVGVAAGHGRIYAVGGFDGSRPLQTAEYFDPKVCKWTEMPKMNYCRFGVGCCVWNDNIYAVGGSDGSPLKTAERFDHMTNQWIDIAPMNYPRKHVVCVSLGNYIYAIGGNDQNFKTTSVERYDPSLDQWVEMAPLLTARAGCGAGVLDGYLYVVGGYDGTKCLNTVERYDPLSNRWYPVAQMTHAREYVAVCVASSKRTINKRILDSSRSPSPPVLGASNTSLGYSS
ncbi:kelch-like protein 20 isoform X2 [Rhopilema esculentum]|uniref:kelch-like protein 20 isoform X2 n=1 Tax=Rhopilema esculentum TaxID=499914 RepID=UPI0031D29B2A